MLSPWPIRNKVLLGIGLLLVIVTTLSWSGFHGVYAYRAAVRNFRGRAEELPLAKTFAHQVADLRVLVAESKSSAGDEAANAESLSQRFTLELSKCTKTLTEYRSRLSSNDEDDSSINDSHAEWDTVYKIDGSLANIAEEIDHDGWELDENRLQSVRSDLDQLQDLAFELPSHLHRRLHDFAGEVRNQYRALIILTWITTVLGLLMLGLFLRLFYAWVFRPLQVLIQGSRRVAAGEFGYRIALDTRDEMSELADALNDMTSRFQTIRDDLDHQVRERTKQVVRNEQLASVGFLAAGVAHEINNPLASIALCAESLESRCDEALADAPGVAADDKQVIRNYLQMIQNEAFRCKGITERLLDFSRTSDAARQNVDLRQLVRGVIDVVAHLGRHQDKRIELAPGEPVIAAVKPQEIKQVVLNLITNALDSLSPGGKLSIQLGASAGRAEMIFTDNGCGMTDEVLKHLFEPFFTRRRGGQGTGLGLSISYRIVADHGGHIDVHSDGPDRGSSFRVWLPLTEKQKEIEHRYQAA